MGFVVSRIQKFDELKRRTKKAAQRLTDRYVSLSGNGKALSSYGILEDVTECIDELRDEEQHEAAQELSAITIPASTSFDFLPKPATVIDAAREVQIQWVVDIQYSLLNRIRHMKCDHSAITRIGRLRPIPRWFSPCKVRNAVRYLDGLDLE